MPNRLAHETSPYLLQHAHNPVDWFPWSDEAWNRARGRQQPVFLSIGYSACHWCHVMERESFEDEAIAALLNENFVCIKVDREERPDLDQIYMHAVQLLTGRGGWPMSVFLTPDQQPFFGGTYWPPRSRMQLPGFEQVLRAVLDAWQHRRDQVLEQSRQLTDHIAAGLTPPPGAGELSADLLHEAASQTRRQFDFTHGGFGRAPKFPHPMNLQLLLRVWSRRPAPQWIDMVRLTLDKMSRGGIYDHLAGGFARYSVDERWLVPHFEKMLYDNALLADAYLDGFLATGDPHYATVVRQILDYVLRDMTDAGGGFHSTEDADSEGTEGKFYLWTPAQIRDVLGEEIGERFCQVYDVTDAGNFEGRSILNLPQSIQQCAALRGWDPVRLQSELEDARVRLLQARHQRVRPGKDDKVLVSWNGLMLHSLARAGAVLDCEPYVAHATRAAEFLLTEMRQDGRLWHVWRQGRRRYAGYLDDYACLANGLITLYESTFEERWLRAALDLLRIVLARFADRRQGGFYYTADDQESLISRPKDFQDGSVPSASAMAATALLRAGKLCGLHEFQEAARAALQSNAAWMAEHPLASAQMLLALDLDLGPTPEIVVLGIGGDVDHVLQFLRRQFHPRRVVAARSHPGPLDGGCAELDPLFAGKASEEPAPTLYICENFACREPARGRAAAVEALRELAAPAQP
jgi:uncharacterized protein YyaL (SSP411 family)